MTTHDPVTGWGQYTVKTEGRKKREKEQKYGRKRERERKKRKKDERKEKAIIYCLVLL